MEILLFFCMCIFFGAIINSWYLLNKKTKLQIEWLEMRLDDETDEMPSELDLVVNGKKVSAKRR